MLKRWLVVGVLLLAAGFASGCVAAATPPPVPAAPVAVNIQNLCGHSGARVEVQGILRLPDAFNCTKNEQPNWCTVQLYDPYYDLIVPVNLNVSANGTAANQMAAMPKSYGYADFKVQTGAGGLVGHGALVALTGTVGTAGQAVNEGSPAACGLSDVTQVTALQQLTPVGIAVKKYDLAAALGAGVVTAVMRGSGLERLELQLKAQGSDLVEINIAAGTVFEALTGGVQNMVVRQRALVVVRPIQTVLVNLDAACANMDKKEPGRGDLFKLSAAPAARDLQKLLDLAEFGFASNRVQQFAVWTITDNPHVAKYVGIETMGGISGGLTGEEIAEIRQLFSAAGIVLDQYNLFK